MMHAYWGKQTNSVASYLNKTLFLLFSSCSEEKLYNQRIERTGDEVKGSGLKTKHQPPHVSSTKVTASQLLISVYI